MPMKKSKTTKKREAKPKTDSAKSDKMPVIKAKATLDVADATPVVTDATPVVTGITNAMPVVSDATPDVTGATKHTQEDELESLTILLNSEDDEKNSSVLMTPEKTSHKTPLTIPHIITPPPIQTPKLRRDVRREQKTLESIQEKVDFISRECPYEVLDSPAAKQPRGKQTKRGGTMGSSRTRGCRRKAVSASKIDSNSSAKEPQSSSQNETSQELKIESPFGGTNKKLHDTKISDYYPIRRSSRRTEAELKKEIDQNFQDCIESKQQDGLEEKEVLGKGRGIFATRTFARNEFVVEYAGDLIDVATAKMKESEYLAKRSGCYMYYFNYKNKNYCIDATPESPYFGRLVNHSRVRPNCHTKVVEVKGQPHLVLLASRKIEIDEELLYDYGDRSKEALAAHPWLAL